MSAGDIKGLAAMAFHSGNLGLGEPTGSRYPGPRGRALLPNTQAEVQCSLHFYIKRNVLSDRHVPSSVMLGGLNRVLILCGHLESPSVKYESYITTFHNLSVAFFVAVFRYLALAPPNTSAHLPYLPL